MTIKPGQKAPDFTLVNTQKQTVTLSHLAGSNVVLLFFPFAFSGICTAEMCTVRDNISSFNHLKAQVFGISVDSHYALKAFKDAENLSFELLSDFNKEAGTAYDTLYADFPPFSLKGVSNRAAFVIDDEGVVQYAEYCPHPGHQPDFDKIVGVLNQLSARRV